MPTEKSLLRTCERVLKARGIVYRKRHGDIYAVKGDPDLYFLFPRPGERPIHVEIELKRPGEAPTRLQQVRLDEWARAGALTGVVWTIDDLRGLLKRLEKSANTPAAGVQTKPL
jgi:hypothetical protein